MRNERREGKSTEAIEAGERWNELNREAWEDAKREEEQELYDYIHR